MKASRTFESLFKQTRGLHADAFVCFYRSDTVCEVGLVSSKKVGNAVSRNFARRRMRELFRAHQSILPDGRYVLVAKKPITKMPFDLLSEQFGRTVKNLQKLR
ncbi:ribonuclease P protein component [Campylobacterota bacterium]|nr:ribonuclease P protein component [Campylobacterota bacterium]